jgi:tetratricopeptide (TPR) repeat protein
VTAAISVMLESNNLMDEIDTLNFTDKEKYQFKGQYMVLNNSLANFYNQTTDYDIAIGYYDNAYDAALKLGAKVNAGVILSNKGDLLLNLGRIDEAIKAVLGGKKLKVDANAH